MQNFLGDMTTRIRNGHRARLGAVLLHPATPKLYMRLLEILREEGYIVGVQYVTNSYDKLQIKVILKYDALGTSVIKSFFQISKPSRRIHVALNSL
jgi:ribosomal protein S8